MAHALSAPRDGVPPLAHSAREIRQAAELLAGGIGPLAVDTERASGYRYDDRAFVLQFKRRGAGLVLIDPEGLREVVTAHLAPAINGVDWIIHAATTDLPCLAELGLYPGSLFDTELAGRLAGYSKVNLGAMVEQVLGYELAKNHGWEDWSTRPLPADWLTYAALDVELLIELAEAMSEILSLQGKLDWAEEEFDYILRTHDHGLSDMAHTWQDSKGVLGLKSNEQRCVFRALWTEREKSARSRDVAVGRVLSNRAMLAAARTLPDSPDELAKVKGFPGRHRGARHKWFQVIAAARNTDPATWPGPVRRPHRVPGRSGWANYPEAEAVLADVRHSLQDIADEVDVPLENLLKPATVRELVWLTVEEHSIVCIGELIDEMTRLEARPWQIGLTAPTMAAVIFGDRG
ncbi:HRDC domain-containing protein [Corynebacterium mendelii]|uniref:Ribonuclease D n=1 Tax=Corynebacterium mendelii TaxID=2765362 RepID=A0A939IWF4_9CORY|nr:HRDC domain-containing protein [Corynebacterium mendelii]MBN9643355.1 ribonuclease D [Corynebacterium mendelii]